ncbi:MAG: hypothetical protein JW881_21520 [Spirochaetales bacterium]|nr:hypothetical protein [Spirochaetales bacterium]
MYQLVIPLGIATIICLIITFLLGLRTQLVKAGLRVKIHIGFAITTLVLAVVHGGIVIYYNLIV